MGDQRLDTSGNGNHLISHKMEALRTMASHLLYSSVTNGLVSG